MHQYRITKLLRIINSDTLRAELDLGFHVKTAVTFRVARITEPELDLDLDSAVDPAVELRRALIGWFKDAPKPWTVQMYKEGDTYTGDVLDKNGNLLSEALQPTTSKTDETVSVNYGLSMATQDPGSIS